jgi:alkylation response protein AidB-like acyl-CoA dehydrogenase
MDFSDTPEEAAFRAEARAWLEANAEPLAPGETQVVSEEASLVPDSQAWQAKKADAGWACITWPKEFGGRGATAIQSVIWGQEESNFRVSGGIFGIGHGMAGPTLMAHGTPEQQKRWIPKLLSGEEIWCQLFSEPSAGSDLAGLRTRAERDGDEWLLNGQKIWTSGAHYSKWGILVARTDPTVPKHAGLTYFVLDMESPGVEIRPIKQVSGASGFSEVFFTDVRIPDENRISEVGNGWAVSITTLMNERASIGGGRAGMGFDELIALARSSKIGDRRALDDASVRHRLADFYVKTKGLQYTGYRALTALSRGKTPGPENSIGKLVGARMRQEEASLAMDLQGEAGILMDPDVAVGEAAWQNAYLAAPGGRIAGGTDEIMRNIVAERVLRLPPEPRLDKTVAFREIPSGPKS